MTQLALAFQSKPSQGTQCDRLLQAFQRGESLTVAEALGQYGIYALSQRVGELKRRGWPIRSEPYKTPGGATVAVYYLARTA